MKLAAASLRPLLPQQQQLLNNKNENGISRDENGEIMKNRKLNENINIKTPKPNITTVKPTTT